MCIDLISDSWKSRVSSPRCGNDTDLSNALARGFPQHSPSQTRATTVSTCAHNDPFLSKFSPIIERWRDQRRRRPRPRVWPRVAARLCRALSTICALSYVRCLRGVGETSVSGRYTWTTWFVFVLFWIFNTTGRALECVGTLAAHVQNRAVRRPVSSLKERSAHRVQIVQGGDGDRCRGLDTTFRRCPQLPK